MLLTDNDVFMKGDHYCTRSRVNYTVDPFDDGLLWCKLPNDFPQHGQIIGTSRYAKSHYFARPIKPFYPEKLVEF